MKLPEGTRDSAVKRLRRVEGQLAGIARMVEDGRDCEEVVTQLAAASKALARAGFLIVASGMRECVAGNPDGTLPEEDLSRMERLFLSLA